MLRISGTAVNSKIHSITSKKKDCRHSIFIEFICSLQILLRQDHFLLFAAFYDRMAAEFIPECCHYLTVECIILK